MVDPVQACLGLADFAVEGTTEKAEWPCDPACLAPVCQVLGARSAAGAVGRQGWRLSAGECPGKCWYTTGRPVE